MASTSLTPRKLLLNVKNSDSHDKEFNMKPIQTLIAASFALLFVLVITSQSSFGQHGATFLPDQEQGSATGVAKNATSFSYDRTPSMKRPARGTSRTSNRGRSIGVASPAGNSSGRSFQHRKKTGYAEIRRPSSNKTRRPNPAGATAEFF